MGSLDSLDPAKALQPAELLLARARFQGLTVISADTKRRVEGGLASSWKASADATRYEFVLREGLRSSDGSPITSGAVRAWFDRLARRSTGSPHAFVLSQIVGFREVNLLGSRRQLRGIDTPTPRKIVFRLSAPFSEFPVMLAHPAAGIVPGPGEKFGPSRASTGPFVLREVELGRRAVLERNLTSRGPTALLERIELRVVQDGARALRARTVDVAYVRGEANLDATVSPVWATLSLGVNLGRLGDLGARRAIRLALDLETLSQKGPRGVPAPGLVPGSILPAPQAPRRDPVEARERWSRANKPASRLRLVHLNDDPSRELMAEVRRQLNAAGIPARTVPVSPAAYPRVLAEKRFDLIQLGWLAEVPSPDGFLAGQLLSTSVDNKTGFQDEAFDQAIARARRTVDPGQRLEAYASAQQRALGQLPNIPLIHLVTRIQGTERLRGLVPDGSGSFDPATVWLAPIVD